jgi:hypothetical protein
MQSIFLLFDDVIWEGWRHYFPILELEIWLMYIKKSNVHIHNHILQDIFIVVLLNIIHITLNIALQDTIFIYICIFITDNSKLGFQLLSLRTKNISFLCWNTISLVFCPMLNTANPFTTINTCDSWVLQTWVHMFVDITIRMDEFCTYFTVVKTTFLDGWLLCVTWVWMINTSGILCPAEEPQQSLYSFNMS